jgi:hypothetical protein
VVEDPGTGGGQPGATPAPSPGFPLSSELGRSEGLQTPRAATGELGLAYPVLQEGSEHRNEGH